MKRDEEVYVFRRKMQYIKSHSLISACLLCYNCTCMLNLSVTDIISNKTILLMAMTFQIVALCPCGIFLACVKETVIPAVHRMKKQLRGMSPYTDRATAACQKSQCQLFANRGCHVVSVRTLRPYSRFSRPEPLIFLPNRSSIVVTWLSGPRCRPTTSQKIW
jgi:hypothetical protein